MKITDELIAEIKKAGIAKAALRSGVSKNTIYRWVYCGACPSLDNAAKVADGLGLELLLFDKE